MSGRTSRRRRAARVLLGILALVAVLVAAGWAWLESDGAAHRMRRWLESRATDVLDRTVRIGALELDVVPFRLDLEDLRVADGRPGEPPFLRVERLELRIQPWALLSRRAVLDSLVLHRPVLHLDLLEDGGTNAPSPPQARGTGAIGVELERLDVIAGRLELDHRPTRIQAELAGVAVEFRRDPVASVALGTGFDGGQGRIVIEDGELEVEPFVPSEVLESESVPPRPPVAVDGTATAAGEAISLGPLGLDVRFTVGPEEISVDDLSVRIGDNRAVATGTIHRWERTALDVDARLELADVHEVRSLPGPDDYRGNVAYSGRVLVEDGELHLDGRVRSQEATLAGLGVADLEAGLRLSPARIEVLDIEARTLEGHARGEVVVDRGDEEGWTIDYRLEGIDLRRLTAWEPLAGLRFSGTGDAHGTLRWRTPWRSTLRGEGIASLRVPVSFPPADSPAAAGAPAPGPASVRDDASADEDRSRPSPRTVSPPGAAAAPLLPLPVTAELSHSLADGVLTVRSGELRLRDTRITATGRLDLDGTVSLDVDLQTADLRMIDILASQIRDMVDPHASSAPLRLGLEGDAHLSGNVSGPFRDPLLQGRLRSRQLAIDGRRVGALEADVAYRRPRLHLASLEVRKGEGAVRGGGWLRLGTAEANEALPADYDVDLSLDAYPLRADLPVDDGRLVVDGPVSGTVELRGAYDGRPRGTVDVRTRGLRIGDLPALEVAARADLSAEVWSFARLRAAPMDGEGQVVARGNWRPEGATVDGSLDLEGLDLAWLGPMPGIGELGGRLSGEASVAGALPLPAGTATLRWSDATVGDTGLGNLVTALRSEEGLVSIRALGAGGSGVEAAALPPPSIPPTVSASDDGIAAPSLPGDREGLLAVAALLRLPGAASSPPPAGERDGAGRAAVRLEAPPQLLSLLLEIGGFGLPPSVGIDGALVARGEGPLGDWQAWRGEASLADLQLGLERVTLRANRPLEAELDGHVLSLRLPSLGTEHGTMSIRAVLDLAAGQWREAEISGDVDLAVARIWRPDWRVSGFGRGTVRLAGALTEPVVRGALNLEDGSFGHADLPWEVTELRGSLQFEGDRIRLEDVHGSLGERPLSVTGTLPFAALAGRAAGQPVGLEFDLRELPLGPALERTEALGEFLTGGDVTVTGSIQGRGLDWRGYRVDLHLRELRLRMSRYEIALTSPARLTLDGGFLEIPSTTFRGAGSDFRVEGTVDLSRRRLDLSVDGDVDLDPLNTLSEEWGVAGNATVDLRVRGPVSDPLYEAVVDVRDGLLNPPPLNQPIDGIRARLRADGRRLVIEELTGELGGGQLSADGEILLRESRPRSFRINLELDEGLIRLERQVRLTANGQLTYEGTVEQSLLTGTIDVDAGVYARQWSPGEPLLEAMAGPDVENPFLDTVRLDLRLVVPRNLRIDNDLARMEMRADLDVRGTLEAPVLLGRAEALEGEIFWQGNTYRVLRGVVEFNNPLETEPLFDVRAETTMRQYTITLNFSGSFDKGVQFSYSSNPPLSDLDLIGLLALGRDPEATRGQEASLGSTVGLQATRYLTAEYFAEVERGAQRVFGIDRFRIEPSLQGQRADPTARLTVGEQVTKNLFVTYSTLLGTSEEQLVTVEYQLTRDIRITGIREEDGSLGIDFHFDFRF